MTSKIKRLIQKLAVLIGKHGKSPVFERIIAACALPLVLFMALPLLVYALNWRSIDIPVNVLLLGSALLFAAFFIMGVLVALIPYVGTFSAFISRWATITLVLLMIFPNRTGEITGFNDGYAVQSIWPYVVKIIVLGGGGLVLACIKPNDFRWLFRVAFLTMIAAVIAGTGYYASLFYLKKHRDQGALIDKSFFTELGTEKNAIIIVLDSFGGQFAKRVLDGNAALHNSFEGFELFPKAIAPALSTPAGLCALLIGDLEHAINEEQKDVRCRKFLASSFLYEAQRKEWQSCYISPIMPDSSDLPVYNEQIFAPPPPIDLADTIRTIGGFWVSASTRVLPVSFANTLAGIRPRPVHDIRQKQTLEEGYRNLATLDRRSPVISGLVLRYFTEQLHVGNASRKIIFLHSKLTHPPWSITADGHYSPKATALDTATYGLQTVAEIVRRLADLNLLDKTLIMAVSDHGLLDDDNSDFIKYNPLVLMRKPGAKGSLKIHDMTVWLGDVTATVRDFAGCNSSTNSTYASRSLLLPADSGREVSLPLFMRPEQTSFHGALKYWKKVDQNGKYDDFRNMVNAIPNDILKRDQSIKIMAGIDRLALQNIKEGWIKQTATPKYAAIVADGVVLAKNSGPGLAVMRQHNGAFRIDCAGTAQKQQSTVAALGGEENVIIAAVAVDSMLLKEPFFRGIASACSLTTPVNFIYASGPSIKGEPIFMTGTNDLSVTVSWHPAE